MSGFEIRGLTPQTWDAFVDLCERHGGGGFGGCCCTWFHRATHPATKPGVPPRTAGYTREMKRDLVEAGRAHVALVLEGVTAGTAVVASPARLSTPGKKVSATPLGNATRSTFEQAGLVDERPKGKNHCIMRTTVAGR